MTIEQSATEFIKNANQSQLAAGPFIMKSPSVSMYSQQLWVIAKVVMSKREGMSC